jgi:hypothetical protein
MSAHLAESELMATADRARVLTERLNVYTLLEEWLAKRGPDGKLYRRVEGIYCEPRVIFSGTDGLRRVDPDLVPLYKVTLSAGESGSKRFRSETQFTLESAIRTALQVAWSEGER